MKNSWNKVVALMLAAALCVFCGVAGFAEDTQTDRLWYNRGARVTRKNG